MQWKVSYAKFLKTFQKYADEKLSVLVTPGSNNQ